MCIEAEDTSDSDEGEIEVNAHGDMASDDASDGLEEEIITNEPASDEDCAPDDDGEVPREGVNTTPTTTTPMYTPTCTHMHTHAHTRTHTHTHTHMM